MHLVISYDIQNDRRRYKVARLLKGCGQRVQYSVFEVYLSEAQLKEVEQKLKKLISRKQDTVRIYNLSGPKAQPLCLLGVGTMVEPPGTMVV